MSIAPTISGDVTRFTKVDATSDPTFFIRFVDAANEMESVKECKRKMFDLMNIQPGDHVLDLGCGTGDDAREMAQQVGPNGWVIGLDNSDIMIAEARRRAEHTGLAVDFRLGDAHHLEFATGTFEVCRAERLLMHVPEPHRVVAEMTRVLKPGGRVVIFDFDWDAIVIAHPNKELTREIVLTVSDSIRNGQIGRWLPGLIRAAGLVNISVTPHTILPDLTFFKQIYGGTLKRAQETDKLAAEAVTTWWSQLEEVDQGGQYFAGFTGYVFSGYKEGRLIRGI